MPEIENSTSDFQHSWRNPTFVRVLLFIIPTIVIIELAGAVSGLKIAFMEKEQLGIGPTQLGFINLVLGLPSYMQPFIGAWTDMFAFFGYHRRSYFVAAKVVAVAGLIMLSLFEKSGLASNHEQKSLFAIVGLLMLIASGGILRVVIFNAIMVALGNITGRFGQLIAAVSLIPIVMRIAYTANLSGIVAEHWSYERAFLTCAVLNLLSIPLVLIIDESRTSVKRLASESQEEHADRLELKRSERLELLRAMRTAFKSPGLWALVGFVFYLLLTPGVNNTKLYFYQDYLHFSREFIGSLGVYQNAGLLIGYFLYGLVARRIPVYLLAWGAFLMDCLSYPSLLLIRDHHSAMAVEVVYAIIGAVYGVCLNTLAARLCPRRLEGVIYGLVMSAIAFASQLSELIGAKLYDYYGPGNIHHHYTLQHGWTWSLWFGFGFTVIAVVFIPFLPKWTRSHLHAGDLTDADVAGTA